MSKHKYLLLAVCALGALIVWKFVVPKMQSAGYLPMPKNSSGVPVTNSSQPTLTTYTEPTRKELLALAGF